MEKNKQKDAVMIYSKNIGHALVDVFTNKESEFYIDIERENVTDIVTGMCIGFLTVLGQFTRSKDDFLALESLVNRLIVQYLLEHGTYIKSDNVLKPDL